MSFHVQDFEQDYDGDERWYVTDVLIICYSWIRTRRNWLYVETGKWYRNHRIFVLPFWARNFYPSTLLRNLGIVFDRLSFNDHTTKTVSSCTSALGQIRRVKHVCRKNILVTMINSLVFSKLYYCSSVGSNTSASNIRKLQGVQNFAARIVSWTRKSDHVTPAPKNLRWIPVKSHLYLRDAILALKSMARGNISGRATRSYTQLNIPLLKTKSGERSFSVSELWLCGMPWNPILN